MRRFSFESGAGKCGKYVIQMPKRLMPCGAERVQTSIRSTSSSVTSSARRS